MKNSFFFTEADNENVSQEHTFESIKQNLQATKEWVAKQEP